MEAAAPANHVQRAACKCGPPPELCVPDETLLTQFAWRPSSFRIRPRADRGELGLSVLIGRLTVEEAARYVLMGQPPPARQLASAAVRLTTAGDFRRAGFAVVHTPGRVKPGIHATVVWPNTDPIRCPDGNWNTQVSDLFNMCFNEQQKG